MNKKIIAFAVFVSLLICKQGYCLFRDDVAAQQVKSLIRIQRAKDEQRKKQYDQVKQQEKINEETLADDMTYSSQTPEQKTTKKEDFIKVSNNQENKPTLQYKRYNREGLIVDTAPPVIVPTKTIVKQEEKKHSNNGIVFLFLVLGIGGFIVFRRQQKK